ncbi:MAG: hypothetical protein V1659_02040 [Candidatus Woesearchaeota archaeon]
MTKKFNSLVVFTAVILALAYAVSAAPYGANVTAGVQERRADSSADTVVTEGGNITEVNVSGNQITSKWAGFFGVISGGIELADASNNKFYEWTVSDVTNAVVFASEDTVSDWGSVAAGDTANMPANVKTAAADNYTNTFNETGAFNSSTLNVGSVPYAKTWQSGTQGTLKTYYLLDGSDIICAGLADDGATGFNGDTVDYQILIPGMGVKSTWYFYMELP